MTELISRAGATPYQSQGYKYATCLNVNSGVVHGIPISQKLKSGDVICWIWVYVSMAHSDTSISVPAEKFQLM